VSHKPHGVEIGAVLVDERCHQPVEHLALALVEGGVGDNGHAPHDGWTCSGLEGPSRRRRRLACAVRSGRA